MSETDSTIPVGFRQIKDFPRYAINKNGTILSICITGNGSYRTLQWSEAHQVSPQLDSHGYRFIVLHGPRRRKASIHTLVLEAFIGPCPDGMECRHLDGDRTNNHVTNLVWGTRTENVHDMLVHGTLCHGERNSQSKLTKEDVQQIRQRAANGETHQSIANDFPVVRSIVTRIIQRIRWNHI